MSTRKKSAATTLPAPAPSPDIDPWDRPDFAQWFERETIERAEAGDHEAGMEALRLCCEGLATGNLSQALNLYLQSHLRRIVDGMDANAALCIARKRGAGNPATPFPEWKVPIAMVAAILERRGYKPEDVIHAMDKARRALEGKSLCRTEAQKIRKNYKAAVSMSAANHWHLAKFDADGKRRKNVNALQVLLDKYPRMS